MMMIAEHAEQNDLVRFHLEAEAVARLRYPKSVRVFEVGDHSRLSCGVGMRRFNDVLEPISIFRRRIDAFSGNAKHR